MKPPVILRIFKGNQLIEVKQFDLDQIIIGNGGDVQVNLQDENISTIHCLIELRDNGYYLADLGSAKGTFKNDNQILDDALSSGDQIKLGAYTLHFFVGVPKPKAPPVSATPPKTAATSRPLPPPAPVAPPPPPMNKAASEAKPKPKVPAPSPRPTATISVGQKVNNKNFHTFAPASEIQDLREALKPTKGPLLEVIVSWKERVLSVQHFETKRGLTVGSAKGCDISIPEGFGAAKAPFVQFAGGTRVQLQSSWEASVIRGGAQDIVIEDGQLLSTGQLVRTPSTAALKLEQNEVAALQVGNGSLQIFVRHVPLVNQATLAGLDLTGSEVTSLVVSLIAVALVALYMSVYTPPPAEDKVEDQLKLATVIFNKKEEPKPEPVKIKPQEDKTPVEQKPVKVAVTEKPKESKGVPEKKAAPQQKANKAAEVAAKNNKNKPKTMTSVKQGAAVKVSDKEGANAKSMDVNKQGLLATFGGEGVRKDLDKAYSGSGDLMGMSQNAKGTSGQNSNRGGDDVGSKFKDSGAGGKGTATEGISGIGTHGRTSGESSYGDLGAGSGKGRVNIDAGGSGAEFVGTVDKEAVRRVVKSITAQIKNCYERALNSHSDLEGKIVVHWEVGSQGHVTTSKPKEASSELMGVANCVALRLSEQRFPEPPVGAIYEVDFPFVFGKQN